MMSFASGEIYQEGGSPLHRARPEVKLVALLILIVIAVVVRRWQQLFILLGVAGLGLFSCGNIKRWVFKDLFLLRWLYLITIAFHLGLAYLFPEAEGQAVWWKVALEKGVYFSVKIAIIATSTSLVFRTTRPRDIALSLTRRGNQGSPGLLSHLGMSLALSLWLLPQLWREAIRIRWAQMGRGWNPGGKLRERVENLSLLVVPLINVALYKGEELRWALEARGFQRGWPGNCLDHQAWGAIDILILGLVLGAVGGAWFAQ